MAIRLDLVVAEDGEAVDAVFMEEGWAMIRIKIKKKNVVKTLEAVIP